MFEKEKQQSGLALVCSAVLKKSARMLIAPYAHGFSVGYGSDFGRTEKVRYILSFVFQMDFDLLPQQIH